MSTVPAPTDQQPIADPLAAGRAALARGAWGEARDGFEAALAVGGESGEALEGIGWAGWWLADERLTFDARERAFRAYRAEGRPADAARVAAWLAADHREFRGDGSVGRGWLARAHSLVAELPESADHGWVTLIDADFALNLDADVVRAERLSLEAAQLGRRLAVPDLEAVGLAQGGIATVLQGRVEEGMRRLDEASVIAASEDLRLPVSAGWALCCLISACDGVGDFPRAAQWCDAMRAYTERWGGRQVLGVCRSAYGRVLAAAGDWPAAEVELTGAVADIAASRPGMAASGLMRLGEHRARQGRPDEARALFEQAGSAGLVGLGQLDLDGGDPRAAADTAERVLRAVPEAVRLERLPALELLARARSALGEHAAATAALDELRLTVEQIDTPYLRARERLVAGELAAAHGDQETARQAYEDAVDCFTEGSAPYETAVARMGLAAALAALGEGSRAETEAGAARAVFTRLGARRDLDRAPLAARDSGELSPRELEVLTLVAQGLSDAAIAERLVVSPHTVHRHVANIRAKLRLPSRAAAVAYAAREGLL
ncbi:MAG TPA: LuxR C-terminal-related transcriptional regulator [Thermoleophilaceae bacterium]|nr:LuxR C-terminal-related transcriptional regulator [Thermoleophilaceae bacterium]